MKRFFAVIVASAFLTLSASAATKAAAPAPTPLPSLASIQAQIDAFMTQLGGIEANVITNTIAALQAADADAGTVITPANGSIPAVVKDPISHACYPAQIQYLQALPSLQTTTIPAPYNLIVLFQYKRDFINLVLSGQLIPTYLKLGCAPLLGNEAAILVGTLGLVGVGASALGPITAAATALGATAVAFPTIGALIAIPK
jgi:hypothetical protein